MPLEVVTVESSFFRLEIQELEHSQNFQPFSHGFSQLVVLILSLMALPFDLIEIFMEFLAHLNHPWHGYVWLKTSD